MAGGMALNDYHKMGRQIMDEAEDPEREANSLNDPDNQDLLKKADTVTRQLLDSGQYEMTDGGIQTAIEEGIRRVYAEYGKELNPDEIANLAASTDFGAYIPQPEVYAEELTDRRAGRGTIPEKHNQTRPIRRPPMEGMK